MKAWTGRFLSLGLSQGWAAYGPKMLNRVAEETQNGTVVNYTLHLSPTSFLESAARIHARGPDQEKNVRHVLVISIHSIPGIFPACFAEISSISEIHPEVVFFFVPRPEMWVSQNRGTPSSHPF